MRMVRASSFIIFPLHGSRSFLSSAVYHCTCIDKQATSIHKKSAANKKPRTKLSVEDIVTDGRFGLVNPTKPNQTKRLAGDVLTTTFISFPPSSLPCVPSFASPSLFFALIYYFLLIPQGP